MLAKDRRCKASETYCIIKKIKKLIQNENIFSNQHPLNQIYEFIRQRQNQLQEDVIENCYFRPSPSPSHTQDIANKTRTFDGRKHQNRYRRPLQESV